eukprot:TRINITY_DN2121_c0_g1_i2.p1 TRINITY_DN2121_c0_g1~~TRINITY_DN2121_c0_g1_i2.p1  ORF type:complete len:185 (-),score=50.74 TRINITY_DN2121_c0_g1_i2:108-662(-)
MTADRLVEKIAGRGLRGNSLGSIIINLQRTRLDHSSSIRIWSRLSDFFGVLSEFLELDKVENPIWVQKEEDRGKYVFDNLPYLEDGKAFRNRGGEDGGGGAVLMTLNLSIGSFLKIVDPMSPNFNAILRVTEVDKSGDWVLEEIPSEKEGIKKRRRLHRWWVDVARRGRLEQFPLVNVVSSEQF